MRIPDLSEIPDLEPVAANVEYDLKITKAKDITSNRTGREGIMLVCQIMGEENAENLIHRIWLPNDSDPEDKQKTMWRMIKEFLGSIGASTDGLETEELEGMEFSAILGQEKNEQNGRIVNTIQRVV